MTLVKFVVFDSKVGASLPPFYAQTRATGLRQWNWNCNVKESDWCRYPGDYTLFELGEYECDTMLELTHEVPINHGLATLQINTEV